MVKWRDDVCRRVQILHGLGGLRTAEEACQAEMAEVSPAFVRLMAYRMYGDRSRWGTNDPRWNFRFKQKENSQLVYQARMASETHERDVALRLASRKYATVEYERTWTPQDQYREFMSAR